MDTKTRHARADSIAAALKASHNAHEGIREPLEHAPVPAEARPFWDALMRNRPRDRWNDADLANAATLATCQWRVDRLQRELLIEPDLVDGKVNPKHVLLEKSLRLVMSLSRMLHVHPEATEGRSRDAGNNLELELEAVSRSSNVRLHPLLKRPG